MDEAELRTRLKSIEWDDVEFKEAAWAAPKSALETVSAFANTSGGYLVFGIKETDGTFTVTGVAGADQVQNSFLGQLRDTHKVSVMLPVNPQKHDLPEGIVLVFYIPEAERRQKPVYIDGNPKKAHVRRGGRDETCTGDELVRFMRDAAATRFDAEPLEIDPARCFDLDTVRWYRARFAASNPGKDATADDQTFLHNRGLLVERDGALLPTRAAVLVLGNEAYVQQVLPRIVVDLQYYACRNADYSSDVRWSDRRTAEGNLINAWQAVLDFYAKHGDHPFRVDPATLRRDDDPPDYISFREAAINLLIHQDFGDTTRLPVIRFFRDQTEFFNPGDAFDAADRLLDPGDKQVRNPSVVSAFRRIGLSDQGGTGVPAIFSGWRALGYVPPEIDNRKAEKSFRLTLRTEKLVTEAQLRVQASVGVHLSEPEAAVFAYLVRTGKVTRADIKALTGFSGEHVSELVQRLTAQVLLKPAPPNAVTFELAPHLRTRFGSPSSGKPEQKQDPNEQSDARGPTAQATVQAAVGPAQLVQSLTELSVIQLRLVAFADVPRTLAELMAHVGRRQRAYFRKRHLDPLLSGNLLRMTAPDTPTSPEQRYVLTEIGLQLKTLHEQSATKPSEERNDAH